MSLGYLKLCLSMNGVNFANMAYRTTIIYFEHIVQEICFTLKTIELIMVNRFILLVNCLQILLIV